MPFYLTRILQNYINMSSELPKYIKAKPWYGRQDGGEYAHLHTGDAIDYSEPTAGSGFEEGMENFDAKRDRWYGYESTQWDYILDKWNSMKSEWKQLEDSDDTDYELEMIELGLESKAQRTELEQLVKLRIDVPQYIRQIGSKAQFDGEFVKANKQQFSIESLVNPTQQFLQQKHKEAEKKQEEEKELESRRTASEKAKEKRSGLLGRY